MGIFAGNGHLDTLGLLLRRNSTVIGTPMGVQGCLVGIRVQDRNLLTAGGCCVPAFKYVALIGCYGNDFCSQVGIIALNQIIFGFTAVQIEQRIAEICRYGTVVYTVQIDIGFTATAIQLALAVGDFIGRLAPNNECRDQLVAGSTLGDCLMENARGLGSPGRAAVIRKQNQCIQLLLIQRQTVLVRKLINSIFEFRSISTKLRFCFFPGHGVFHVVINFVYRAGRTITDGPMVHILIRLASKALVFFQQIDSFLADGQPGGCFIRSSLGARCIQQQNAQAQNRCQNKTDDPLFHRV